MPKNERQAIEDTDEIFGFMHQSHISDKNVARLEGMAKSENPQVASLATIVLQVAKVKPYKTRRLKFLARMHPELLRSLEETGLVFAHVRDYVPSAPWGGTRNHSASQAEHPEGDELSSYWGNNPLRSCYEPDAEFVDGEIPF